MRLLIDTDPGVDDAIAILMALAAPNAEVVGLTTVGGNVSRARATRNALALLQAAGRPDIPVARGAARPLSGSFRPSVAFHGPGGLSTRLAEPLNRPVSTSAVDFIEQHIATSTGEITVVALGPLTNLSRLERRHPGTLRKSAGVVVMGGAVETRGNVTPAAEFNFQSDPLAASEVMGLDVPITLADLGACRQVGISREQARALTANTPLGHLALRVLQGWFARDSDRLRFEFYDPLAIALALEPGIATYRRVSLEVGTKNRESLGETTVSAEPGPIAVAAQIDSTSFFRLLRDLLGLSGL